MAADKFSDKAANLICQELDFQRAVDWVHYRTDFPFEYDWLILSDLHCGDPAGQFADCAYGMTHIKGKDMLLSQSDITSNQSHIMLSCNPAPGEMSICSLLSKIERRVSRKMSCNSKKSL